MILVKITVCDHVFDGVMHGKPALSEAEAVFTTSHSGYVESCTDPSYSMQALVFAHSVIGAHGIYENAKQSSVFWPAFVIATQLQQILSSGPLPMTAVSSQSPARVKS